MKILSFGHAEESALPEKPRPAIRFGHEVGAPVMTTTEDAKQKWNSLIVATNNLNVDITQKWFPKHRDDQKAVTFVDAWVRFRDSIYSEYKDNAKWKIVSDMAWSVWNRGDLRLKELDEWRTRWEQLAGEKSTAPMPRSEEQHEPKPNETSPWMWVAITLGGIGVATGVGKAISSRIPGGEK